MRDVAACAITRWCSSCITPVRVQEVVDLKLDDLRLDTPPQTRLFGKGGKDRACPLWAETVQALRRYLEHREPSEKACRYVFLNANGQPFTRFGIRYLVRLDNLSDLAGIM
jgi:integrase/recombinase XerD